MESIEQLKQRKKEILNRYINLAHISARYADCLDEIEEIVSRYRISDSNLFMSMDIPSVRKIFELIKQAKEGVNE